MLLTESEIQEVLKKAKKAFPNLTDWEWNNEKNSDYFGFSLWGKLVLSPSNLMSQSFFITLETFEDKWRGILTIGQHSYFWSSADLGDAHLLSTYNCDTVDEAIAAIKADIYSLCQAFSVKMSIIHSNFCE